MTVLYARERERERERDIKLFNKVFGSCNSIGNVVHSLTKNFRQGHESHPRTMILLKQLHDLMPDLIPKLGVSL